ncbi:alpha/beta hydrolase [Pontixanthobacter aestiaquae]|uniref:Alpha/beta fold hydrolase n=1 Tax=Pontixanthobacter aestiaquae TaxID=1509367 RepID=A0A844Z695_9SPHN|nr:alpha/beta hydrolase [Pontixanthobacter aestiaquae]MDN3645983.1 alpha/beta hydrolase [Pontixanthobacter aestiaquae]MXO83024.1 alpha/beta fold hydrolase [Pontixanthobacter aestiaquae]
MRGIWISGAVLAGMLVAGVAHAQQRLPRECRQEIVQLCGSDRSKIRSCLREKRSELSETCASELRERMQQRRAGNRAVPTRMAPQKFDLVTFGDDPRQAIDFYRPMASAGTTDAPPALILFVHGGGWQMGDRARANHAKPSHFQQTGYAYASTGYRLVPNVKVEDQAADIAAAVAKLRADAPELGFDPNRIILMGHSAGAHLAALVATDPTYLGDDLAAIKGVILLDGAGYDAVSTLETAGPLTKRIYEPAFSADPARQAALSPATYVGAPDVSDWLILHVADRARAKAQSEMFAAKLRKAGANAEAVAIPNTDHRRMNTELGTDNLATEKVDAFIAQLTE